MRLELEEEVAAEEEEAHLLLAELVVAGASRLSYHSLLGRGRLSA